MGLKTVEVDSPIQEAPGDWSRADSQSRWAGAYISLANAAESRPRFAAAIFALAAVWAALSGVPGWPRVQNSEGGDALGIQAVMALSFERSPLFWFLNPSIDERSFRPFRMLLHWLEFRLWGIRDASYLWVSVSIHVANERVGALGIRCLGRPDWGTQYSEKPGGSDSLAARERMVSNRSCAYGLERVRLPGFAHGVGSSIGRENPNSMRPRKSGIRQHRERPGAKDTYRLAGETCGISRRFKRGLAGLRDETWALAMGIGKAAPAAADQRALQCRARFPP